MIFLTINWPNFLHCILVWQSARKRWRYDFKPTKEVPVYHTGVYTVSLRALTASDVRDQATKPIHQRSRNLWVFERDRSWSWTAVMSDTRLMTVMPTRMISTPTPTLRPVILLNVSISCKLVLLNALSNCTQSDLQSNPQFCHNCINLMLTDFENSFTGRQQ